MREIQNNQNNKSNPKNGTKSESSCNNQQEEYKTKFDFGTIQSFLICGFSFIKKGTVSQTIKRKTIDTQTKDIKIIFFNYK